MPAGSDKISQISSNTQLMFAADPLEVVGKKLADVLGQANADQIFAILKAGDWKEANPLKISAKNAAPPLS
jgi:light-regulated signal transduction histidine kinase (bacteriophytochrome)